MILLNWRLNAPASPKVPRRLPLNEAPADWHTSSISASPCSCASDVSASMSEGAPRMCTGRIARVFEVSLRATSSGSSVSESSTSASTGVPPDAITAFGLAFHV